MSRSCPTCGRELQSDGFGGCPHCDKGCSKHYQRDNLFTKNSQSEPNGELLRKPVFQEMVEPLDSQVVHPRGGFFTQLMDFCEKDPDGGVIPGGPTDQLKRAEARRLKTIELARDAMSCTSAELYGLLKQIIAENEES